MTGVELAHPDSQRLADFGLGRLDEIQSSEIEHHVAECMTCRQALEDLPGDPLVSLLQSAYSSQAQASAAPSTAADSLPALYKKVATIISGGKAEPPHKDRQATRASSKSPVPPELADHPRYRVLEPLGAGGMGTVFKAKHKVMERTVALKIINRDLMNKPAAVERFSREVKAAAQLTHPNIVTAYDAERVGDSHFLVMEFVEGKTLAQLVLERGPLPVDQACDYVRQVALGLQHAFERGMVHRDIKPHNLIIANCRLRIADSSAQSAIGNPQSAIVKILDFGLARFRSESGPVGEHGGGAAPGMTDFGAVMGSPDYMAPEQVRDARKADIRADIYGLGCTLYHLLSGQVPFPGGTAAEKLAAQVERTPTPIVQLRPDVSPELARVLEEMMAKDPVERYQTPGEAAAALVAARASLERAPTVGDASQKRRPPDAERVSDASLTSPRRRTPILAAAAVLLLAFGLMSYLAGPAVYRFATNQGQLVVETDDPDVEVVIKQGGEIIKIIDAKTKKEVTLRGGTYEIELSKGKEGLKLSTGQFTMTRNGREIVKVWLEPIAEAKPKPPPAVQALAEPLPLKEFLKTKGPDQFLTVAKEGPAMYRRISDALDNAAPGQVVYVLDKGPYRERWQKALREDVSLISRDRTQIELDGWYRIGQAEDKTKFWYEGSWLTLPRGGRIAGFDFICPETPKDAFSVRALALNVAGDVVIESCRFLNQPRFRIVPPTTEEVPACFHFAMTFFPAPQSTHPARVWFQENRVEGTVDFADFPGGTFVFQRNHFLGWRWQGLNLNQKSGEVVIRENVIHGINGIALYGFKPEGEDKPHALKILIANNVLDVTSMPVHYWPSNKEEKDKLPASRDVRIQNNILRSKEGKGIHAPPKDLAELKEVWRLGHNCFLAEPTQNQEGALVFPRQTTDLIVPSQFLGPLDPKDPGCFRIAADSDLASRGAGGDLPKYIGAFPPGPAPKDGDWFTRLQQELPVDNTRIIKLEIDPKSAEGCKLRGAIHAAMKQWDQALKEYNEAIRLNDKYVQAYVDRSYVYLNTGKLDACIADATRALTLEPKCPFAHVALANRGWALACKGDLRGGLADYDKALELKAEFALGYLARSQIHERLGNLDKAKADRAKAIALDPAMAKLPLNLPQVVPEPSPLGEYLKNKTPDQIITVAQDGSGKYRTIGEAFDVVTSGQVIKVLDKGPYRERLEKNVPADVALVSQVGTRVEFPGWKDYPDPVPGKKRYEGWRLVCPKGMRLSGFEFACPKLPPDTGVGWAVAVGGNQDVTIENCRVLHDPRYEAAPPADHAPAFPPFVSFTFFKPTPDEPIRLCLRDNHLEGRLDIFYDQRGSVLVERNRVIAWRHDAMLLPQRAGQVIVRHNVFQAVFGITLWEREPQDERERAAVRYLIANNVFDTRAFAVRVWPQDKDAKDKAPPVKNVRIHNNIIWSREGTGINMTAEDLAAVKDAWQVSHNCYTAKPGPWGVEPALPQRNGDLVIDTPFIAIDPRDADYLRIHASGSLAAKGVGGDLPSYIGALPPGPAPKEGDWFTRLLGFVIAKAAGSH